MPAISEKGKIMPASPIRKLVPYAEEATRKGRKVYYLNIGQPDIPTPDVALDAVRNITQKVIEYSHSAGNESYRRKLAKFYQNLGIMVDYTDILITTGGSEAILFALGSCINPGEEVITPEPLYANYLGFATSSGINIVSVTSKIENDFALPPIHEVEEKITPKTKGILICNPSNPTGYLYSKDELNSLKELVKKHDLWLFSDEAYREFCYDGLEHFSASRLEGIQNNVVMVDSVSKRYSECGVRIGALITKNREVISTALKFAQARLSPPGLGQIVGEASLDTPAGYFSEINQEYTARRNYMVEALNKIPGVYCPRPKGAFYTMVRLPVDDSDKFAKWLLEEFEYKNQTVMMAPGSGFYSSPGLGKNEVRIAYVLKIEDLKDAIETIAEALKIYPEEPFGESDNRSNKSYHEMTRYKIAILGGGNLGTSLARGLIKSGQYKNDQIILTDKRESRINYLQSNGFNVTSDNQLAADSSDIIVMSVKPQQFAELASEIKSKINSKHIIISTITGVTLREIEAILGNNTLIRIMPNTALAICESMTCISFLHATPEQEKKIVSVFEGLGKTLVIPEDLMGPSTVIGACGIAFALRFMRAMSQGGIEIGFNSEMSQLITAQTVKGAAKLILETSNHPEGEIDKVTTPQGITISGLNEMEHQGLSSAVIRGLTTSYNKLENMASKTKK